MLGEAIGSGDWSFDAVFAWLNYLVVALGGKWGYILERDVLSSVHFFLFSDSIRLADSSAIWSSHPRPTTMEHTDWIKIPEAMSFTYFPSVMLFLSGIRSEWWNIWLRQLENANHKETSVYFGECILPFSLSVAIWFARHNSKLVFPLSTLTYGAFLKRKGPIHRRLGEWTYQFTYCYSWIYTEMAPVSNILTPNLPGWQHSWRKFL